MARIRSIKPEFPQSETIGHLSRDARLLFIQLWTVVDDAGRTRAASRMLASLLYPYDDDARELIGGWLDELEQHGCVRRYELDGTSYLDIPNWLKHQKIDRPSVSRLPEYQPNSTNPREPSRVLDADLGPRTMDLGPRKEDAASDDAPSDPAVLEKQFFERSLEVFGARGRSVGGKILKAKGRNFALARALVETASQKSNPLEYAMAATGPPRAQPQTLKETKQQEWRDALEKLGHAADRGLESSIGGETAVRILPAIPGE
jgi:hypothetical protein